MASDNAGCGKSLLTKVLFQLLTKNFLYQNLKLDKPKVACSYLLASVNIDGTAIHTGLGTAIGNFGSRLPSFSDKMKPR